jgi:hypothetical protein
MESLQVRKVRFCAGVAACAAQGMAALPDEAGGTL